MPPGLAVAPDGRALLAFVAGGRCRVAERAPGGAFAPGAAERRGRPAGDELEVALGSGRRGGGGLAGRGRPRRERGRAARRRRLRGAGDAPARRPDLRARRHDSGPIDIGFAEDLLFGGHLGVAVAGDRATVVWPRDAVTRGLRWRGADAASVPLAGGPTAAELLGSPLRDVGSEAPLTLADGTAAVAWGDAADAGGDRVHLALAGAAAPRRARTPRVRVGRPGVVRGKAPLRLPVSCTAACDVRIQSAGDSTSVSLPRAGRRTARLAAPGRRVHLGSPPERRGTHLAVRELTVVVRRVSGGRSRASR